MHILRTAVVALAMATSALTIAAQPAYATPNDCTAGDWRTDQDIADASTDRCRETFLVDVGRGNHLSRQDLVNARGFYRGEGFSDNFLWYAEMTTHHVSDTRTQKWTGCPHDYARIAGNACGGPVSHHPMSTPGNVVGVTSIDLLAFKWHGQVIARACGNYLDPTSGPDPVPYLLVEKFDDRNRNGVRDSGESGLAGWQFQIKRVSSTFGDQGPADVGTIGTNSAGEATFEFSGHGPGLYVVEELGKDGWAATTANPQSFIVPDGVGSSRVAHLKFGNAQTRADLAKVDFDLVNPPSRLEAHQPVDLTVRAQIQNNGPADVTATDSIDVTVPTDCTAEPAHDETTRTLVAGQSAIVEFRIRVTCHQPSYHPMTFIDRLWVTTSGVEDPVQDNNTKAFEHVFEVFDKADIQLSGTSVSCPPREDVRVTFECTVTADVTNAGPYGPATTEVAFGLQPPSDCTAQPIAGSGAQMWSLTSGQTRAVQSRWSVTCAQRSYHDILATAEATLRHLHLEDPLAGNASAHATTRIEIFEPVDLVAEFIEVSCLEREHNISAWTCTALMQIRNDGPADWVAVHTTLTFTPEADCTAEPSAPIEERLSMFAGDSTGVAGYWELTCSGAHRHSVRVSGTIVADEPHAEDRWQGNNSTTTVWGPLDVKPRSLPSSINLNKVGVVPFALLSTPEFDALSAVDRESLRFGRMGTEDSIVSCATEGEDVNDDGQLDLVCRADTKLMDLLCETIAVRLIGTLTDGTRFQSEDAVKVTGCH